MRYWIVLLLCCVLVGCKKVDERYYWQNPGKLKAAIMNCPVKKPAHANCDQLRHIANKFQYLGVELRRNPQLFGKNIIALQEKVASLKQKLAKKHDETLQNVLEKADQQLFEYLAIVSYYESPRGGPYEDFSQ